MPNMIETRALILKDQNEPFEVSTVFLDSELQDQDVLVEIHATGICHTDIGVQKLGKFPGKFPRVLGHEGAGVVKKIGAGIKHVLPGDKVVLSFAYCGSCPACYSNVPGVCYNYMSQNNSGGRPDGTPTMYLPKKTHQPEPIHASFFGQSSFSRLTICHGVSVIPVGKENDNIPMETLAAFGCGFQTGAGATINCINPAITKPRTLAIFGVGAVGFSALFAAKAACPRETQIIAMDLTPSRLELAREFGAKTINGRDIDLKVDGSLRDAIRELTGEVGLDAAIDTTGHTKLVAQIVGALAPLGKLVTLANSGWTSTVEIKLADLMMNAKQWVGSIEGNAVPKTFIPHLMELHREGKFPVNRLCKVYNAKDINKAIEDAESGVTIKPVLVWE